MLHRALANRRWTPIPPSRTGSGLPGAAPGPREPALDSDIAEIWVANRLWTLGCCTGPSRTGAGLRYRRKFRREPALDSGVLHRALANRRPGGVQSRFSTLKSRYREPAPVLHRRRFPSPSGTLPELSPDRGAAPGPREPAPTPVSSNFGSRTGAGAAPEPFRDIDFSMSRIGSGLLRGAAPGPRELAPDSGIAEIWFAKQLQTGCCTGPSRTGAGLWYRRNLGREPAPDSGVMHRALANRLWTPLGLGRRLLGILRAAQEQQNAHGGGNHSKDTRGHKEAALTHKRPTRHQQRYHKEFPKSPEPPTINSPNSPIHLLKRSSTHAAPSKEPAARPRRKQNTWHDPCLYHHSARHHINTKSHHITTNSHRKHWNQFESPKIYVAGQEGL